LEKSYNNKEVLDLLGKIYQKEISGVNRYLHFSVMIMGYNLIPIQKWFRENAQEAMEHAIEIGEKITSCGGHPPITSHQIEETENHSIRQLLEESLKGEEEAVALYKELASLAEKIQDVPLEEMARNFVKIEVEHVDEVRKMLVKPQ